MKSETEPKLMTKRDETTKIVTNKKSSMNEKGLRQVDHKPDLCDRSPDNVTNAG